MLQAFEKPYEKQDGWSKNQWKNEENLGEPQNKVASVSFYCLWQTTNKAVRDASL